MLTLLNPFDIPSLPAERKLSLQCAPPHWSSRVKCVNIRVSDKMLSPISKYLRNKKIS